MEAKKVEKIGATRISLAPPGLGHCLPKMRHFINKRDFFFGQNFSRGTGIFKDLSTIHEGELQANLKEI